MATEHEWDVGLRVANRSGTMEVTIPKPVARSLVERGYTRARITVTEEGILVAPYKGEPAVHKADIPDW